MSNSFLVWSGKSQLDASALIGAFLTLRSDNVKTGDIPQLCILRLDRHPVEATKDASDSAICGNCQHRPANNGSCYVRVTHGPTAIYKAWVRGNVPRLTAGKASKLVAGKTLRLGSYGDPAAVPVRVLKTLSRHAKTTIGYTHQWRAFASLSGLCMASCDTEQDRHDAHSLGFRTFRVMPAVTDLMSPSAMPTREIICPAAPEVGVKTQCVSCGLCNGARTADRRADIALPVHGSGAKYFTLTPVRA